jgi:hypothetical protein
VIEQYVASAAEVMRVGNPYLQQIGFKLSWRNMKNSPIPSADFIYLISCDQPRSMNNNPTNNQIQSPFLLQGLNNTNMGQSATNSNTPVQMTNTTNNMFMNVSDPHKIMILSPQNPTIHIQKIGSTAGLVTLNYPQNDTDAPYITWYQYTNLSINSLVPFTAAPSQVPVTNKSTKIDYKLPNEEIEDLINCYEAYCSINETILRLKRIKNTKTVAMLIEHEKTIQKELCERCLSLADVNVKGISSLEESPRLFIQYLRATNWKTVEQYIMFEMNSSKINQKILFNAFYDWCIEKEISTDWEYQNKIVKIWKPTPMNKETFIIDR